MPMPAFAILLAAQAQVAPPAPTDLTPPPAFMAAAQGFGACVKAGAVALPASVTPEAGAEQVLAGCARQRQALDASYEAWVAGPGFPEAARTEAVTQYRAEMANVAVEVADDIRKSRAAPPPAAAPASPPTGQPR